MKEDAKETEAKDEREEELIKRMSITNSTTSTTNITPNTSRRHSNSVQEEDKLSNTSTVDKRIFTDDQETTMD